MAQTPPSHLEKGEPNLGQKRSDEKRVWPDNLDPPNLGQRRSDVADPPSHLKKGGLLIWATSDLLPEEV